MLFNILKQGAENLDEEGEETVAAVTKG